MRIKLDENVPTESAAFLRARGHDVDTVPDEGMSGEPDPAVWAAAQHEQRLLVTQDLGFSDIRRFPPGTHHGLLVLRLGNAARRALAERIRELFEHEDVEGWAGALVIATPRKVRVRHRS